MAKSTPPPATVQITPALARSASPSFRLRSPSLNSVRLRRVFDIFDRNGDEEITVEELCLALDRLGLGADADELRPVVAPYIRQDHGGLRYDDFEVFHRALGEALFGPLDGAAAESGGGPGKEQEEEEEDMREAFKVFDENGDGYISAAELKAVLEKLGLPEGGSLESVRQMICLVDSDHDGQVDFKEFEHMMRSIEVKSG